MSGSRITVDAAKGYQVHCETFGSGDPIVFMSGTACNCQIWKQFQVPAFSVDHRVVLFDNRGAGKSDKPAEHYGIDACARDLVAVMDSLKLGRAHLVGHSMGGRIALQAALDYPERVASITLAGSGPGNYSKRPDYPRGIPLDVCMEILENGYEQFYREHYLEEFMFLPTFRRERPEHFKGFEQLLMQDIPPVEHFFRHVIARQSFEVSHRLKDIQAPALVIVGAQDRATKAVGTGDHVHQARALAEALPNAKLVLINNAAHGIFWEQPQKTNEALRQFFSANASRAASGRLKEGSL